MTPRPSLTSSDEDELIADTTIFSSLTPHQLVLLQFVMNQQQTSAQMTSAAIKNSHDTAINILNNIR